MNGDYAGYALRRAGQAVVVVLLAYVFTFVVISVLPGDPVTATLRNPENGFSEEEIARIVAYYGLDQPVYVQLWEALSRFLVGDLGLSLRSDRPVADMLTEVLGSTLALAGTALVVAVLLAFGIAFGAQYLPRPFGPALRAFPSLFLSVPNFLIGLLLIQLLSFQLGLFRAIDADSPTATFVAALTLGIPVSAQIAEVLIANLDHEARQEYATVARSRGLGRWALLLRHLLKPSSLPVVTVLALTVGELLGGAVITEAVFGRTGIGSLVERSVAMQDLPVLQAVVALAAVVFVVVNLVADLVYPLLDPRVSLQAGPERGAAAR
ncbi:MULTISPECIES: ABC transporter permease [Pseudonocardia]|uniref:Glutathione transport system permease protein GsiC n=2 Tax=Pseudonocardia TaxID=1847 RepID=A0A1Y2MTL9_PSEAH|nr:MULTISPECIES: ABC transporter permease [Pseudonocardia]OSY38491.1 Glutathione transport system permease protein GsiC [Pseudonocardia autotrophica]TDN77066.1 peptide/nickel transport system permease protein [Pseudonocardia autotrophica]BBG01072.1 peptide ABC transporter permease [Pseudonocardia autotrophica]GEC26700.1 peptide ABC transporter permease [Pseudonocardia saturnea]